MPSLTGNHYPMNCGGHLDVSKVKTAGINVESPHCTYSSSSKYLRSHQSRSGMPRWREYETMMLTEFTHYSDLSLVILGIHSDPDSEITV